MIIEKKQPSTYQTGVVRHKRFDQILAVGCRCSTEGSESQQKNNSRQSHGQTEG